MALGLFLHHHIELNKTIRESSTTTIEEVTNFWQKARIPVQELRNCQPKLEKLFEQWRLLKKNKNRNTLTQKSKEGEFISKLNNIFDIANANALNMIKISQDKEFLLAQREKGRRGSMLDEFEQEEQASFTVKEVDMQKGNKKRMKVMTPYLAAALHRSKVSDRKAVFVVAETARSLGYEVDEITLSRSSIRPESQFTITPTEEKRIAKDMYICYTCVFKSLDDSFFTSKCTIQ
ncbi:hypothetical protein AVEN_247284-1 [Araneus ventricosus]|uniref:Uncharacterized protein n=1 Tax=Araneus ventricosus TaxID=182803 RepID=A0A4Y2X413_ARAVE|nr:hypothetical protein AVEN_224159-1 [Araneus ventricosus]GBO44291.1 hypothetical protein AVEN_247284-1 [Araneus ventricosus]